MTTAAKKSAEKIEYDSNPFTLSFKGFGLLVDYAKGVFIAMLLFSFIGFLANIFAYIPDFSEPSTTSSSQTASGTTTSVSSTDWGVIGSVGLLIIGIITVFVIIGILISAAYKGFVAAGAIAASERRIITAGEAFSEMSERLGVLFKAEILATLKIIGGYFLLIIPGVRAQLRYQSTPYIIMSHKKLSATESLATSKNLYRNHLMEAFGISTVGAIIPFIGQAISASGMALSVQQLAHFKKLGKATPKTHWLNYIGFIFFALMLFFVTISTLLIVVIFVNN